MVIAMVTHSLGLASIYCDFTSIVLLMTVHSPYGMIVYMVAHVCESRDQQINIID